MNFGTKVKILVIDDLAENLHAMKMTLEPLENVEVYTAQSGNDGLALMLEHDFAVVLLDVQMPVMDGFETAELMQNHEATRNVPIIFVTAISKEDKHVFKGYRSGAVDYLFKPINPEILLSKVKVFVKLYQQRIEFERMQEELQKKKNLEALGILAGGIAHDFNNLLTTVFGNIQLAQMQSKPDSQVHQKLHGAMDAINEAMQLTQQMITFSKGGRPKMERIDIIDLLTDVVALLLSGSDIKVNFNIPKQVDEVEIDKVQISQVFQNLILNAEEAMRGSGNLNIKLENMAFARDSVEPPVKKGKYVRVTIQDNGPGIDPAHIDKIFDPYFSLKVMGASKGQGLGLAIVHSILLKHGGSISVESKPDEGATFFVYLPVTAVQSQDVETSEDLAATSPDRLSSSTRQRILVMEGEGSLAKAFKEMLEHLGYEARVVENGSEAIDVFRQAYESNKPFAAAILELTIHGGEGAQQVLEKLLEIDPGVKAIVASSHADDPRVANCNSYGFVGSIIKPFSLDNLAKAVTGVLGSWH